MSEKNKTNQPSPPPALKGLFKTVNHDGSPKTCKFCHGEVWWHIIENRWYNPGGETVHSETCELRKKHFTVEAYEKAETRRKGRA